MKIHYAALVPDTLRPANIGTKGTQIGLVTINGQSTRAYLKPLPEANLAAECFCALLMHEWGLDVPEPIIVDVDGDKWFGSVDQAYPNLRNKFSITSDLPQDVQLKLIRVVAKIVCSYKKTPLALAIDEAVSNHDRNLENLLWDGGDNIIWIDHERCFNLDDGMPDVNKLAQLAEFADMIEQVQQSAISSALSMARHVIDEVMVKVPFIDAEEFARHVNNRMGPLGNRIIERFPAPINDLFS